ncbi:MAG: hypothetical protein SGI77_21515 [Pirellulaceae bacterium]|nr:hypothetical protein [Pirellulaceae bacterium]
MTLDALKSREEAALFHAARVELEIALVEAESGNETALKLWLSKHQSLIEHDRDLRSHIASFQSAFEKVSDDVGPAIEQVQSTIDDIQQTLEDVKPSFQPQSSPWTAMIEGARHRARLNETSKCEPMALATGSENIGIASTCRTAESAASAAPRTLLSPEASAYESREKTILPIELGVKHEAPNRKRIWLMLSPSMIGSTVAHLVALIGMSAFIVHQARNPEPKAIVASAVETETISMEAPMEMSTPDDPKLDASDVPMPTLPTFAAESAESSNDIQLPTAMAGIAVGETSSPTSDAIQKATGSPSSNSNAMNSVQFFGVKAAGNTFCYVVDASPSMKKDGAFAAAKSELLRSLSQLKPKQRFFISFFGGDIERLKLDGRSEEQYPVYATPENLQKTLNWIERVRIQPKGLPPNNALLDAIKMEPDGIFLLFDGDTTVDVAAYLRKANRSNDLISGETPLVQIHTIGFYTQEFEKLMRRIADENRGSYRFVPNPMKQSK